ncbi:MAG: DUF2905 domain-containing protein [Wenzhouxiangellaceae bacterium]|nr:DUF2905 domain-containing protein [Wenzhouxiangellaceae bacterium]
MHGKILIIAGVVLLVIGTLLHWFPNLFAWFGRLPGDIRIERESGGFYFPVMSMLIVSIALTILVNFFFRR